MNGASPGAGLNMKRSVMQENHGLELNQGNRIDHRIRTSTRARKLRLTLSHRDGLTVVVPRNYDLRRVPA